MLATTRSFHGLVLGASSLSLSLATLFSFPFKYISPTSSPCASLHHFTPFFTNVTSMNKIVLQVEVHDDKTKKKTMKAISSISGVESVCLDMKDQKLTLIGEIDAVVAVAKLRKLCHPKILSVGAAKEPKKEEKKKAENQNKVDQNNNIPSPAAAAAGVMKVCEAYHYYPVAQQPHYYYTSVEENPNACVIC